MIFSALIINIGLLFMILIVEKNFTQYISVEITLHFLFELNELQPCTITNKTCMCMVAS